MSGPRRPRPEMPAAPGPDVPVYVISVAAELTGLHPQTLRTYDRLGLVIPGRTGGGGRRYSWRDIEMLREVAQLSATGIGLEGVRRILDLELQVEALQPSRERARAGPRGRRRGPPPDPPARPQHTQPPRGPHHDRAERLRHRLAPETLRGHNFTRLDACRMQK